MSWEIRNRWDFILALAVRPPQAIKLPAVINVLVAGSIALFFLDGMDQIGLRHLGVIFDAHFTGFSPDVFHHHNEPPGCSFLGQFLYEPHVVLMCGEYGLGELINTSKTGRDRPRWVVETHPGGIFDTGFWGLMPYSSMPFPPVE
jgi:hypothetical protein